jgi:hypothetical protein
VDNNYAHSSEADSDEQSPLARKSCPGTVPASFRNADGILVSSDLPDRLPVLRDEVALLRAFLAAEIKAILDGEE